MPSLNQVTLIGNLTRTPDARRTGSGTAVCDIGLAINEKYNGEDKTVFVDITAWGKTADFCRDYLQKGSSVAVMGRLQLDTWTDNQSGQKRSKLKVVADRIQSLGRNVTPQPQQQPQQSNTAPTQYAPPPPPSPPPGTTGQAPPQDYPSTCAVDVGEESIDSIPF